jgi:N-acetylmuramoyl-L-alanine amidase
VLDPAHGGTDPGAHSEGGSVEKDIVLRIAQTVRTELERQGYRVAMTRYDDSNPSYDDRAAVANTYRDAIFISLHISSTGTPGTVRAYYHQFGTPIASASTATDANLKNSVPPAGNLTRWEEAQRPYVDASHRLGDIIQRELAQFFSGSPVSSSAVAVRGLRSIAAPAVAVEISSVSGPSPNSLAAAAVPIATAIARSIAVFRQLAPGERK